MVHVCVHVCVCVHGACAWMARAVAIARVSLHVYMVLVSGGYNDVLYTFAYIVSQCLHVGLRVYTASEHLYIHE